MAGSIYVSIIGGLTASLRRKWSEVYLITVSFGIWPRQKTSSLQAIEVYLRCILVLLKLKDFFTVSNVSGLKVAE